MPSSQSSPSIVLINVSGRDRPGITAALASVLARHKVTVLDIDQAVIHNNLAWGMLIEVNGDGDDKQNSSDTMFRELLFKAHDLDLDIRFTPVTREEFGDWLAGGNHERCIVTLLGRVLDAGHIAKVTELASEQGWNIASIKRISPRIRTSDSGSRQLIAVEMNLRTQAGDISELRAQCLRLSASLDADIAVQQDNIWRRNRRLVCFDMDSTLVEGEAIDLMAAAAGVGDQVSAITAKAMNGEIDFRESFTQRLSLLKGLPESSLDAVDKQLVTTEGAERLISNLNTLGYRTAIVSGGFTWFAQRLQKRLGIDTVYANELEIKDGKLTGQIIGDIVDERMKASLMMQLAEAEGFRLDQVIAVGDGANDIPMLSKAGLGIAFHAKPAVVEQAQTAFGTVGLDGILYLIGMRETELDIQ